jgi:hypothetical protein
LVLVLCWSFARACARKQRVHYMFVLI